MGAGGCIGLPENGESPSRDQNESQKRMLENNPRKGYKFSKEEKLNHSNKMKNFYLNNPEKILYGEKNPMFGKKPSEEWRKNHSEKMKKNTNSVKSMTVKRPCSKCGFVTTLGNLARYHDGKCKREIESIISSNTFSGLEAQTKFVFWKKV
jgi:DNA-binding transcriptional MocR family regulator